MKSELLNDLIVYGFIYHHVCLTGVYSEEKVFAFLPERLLPKYPLTEIYIQREKASEVKVTSSKRDSVSLVQFSHSVVSDSL